jgi:hypothetical protein
VKLFVPPLMIRTHADTQKAAETHEKEMKEFHGILA